MSSYPPAGKSTAPDDNLTLLIILSDSGGYLQSYIAADYCARITADYCPPGVWLSGDTVTGHPQPRPLIQEDWRVRTPGGETLGKYGRLSRLASVTAVDIQILPRNVISQELLSDHHSLSTLDTRI